MVLFHPGQCLVTLQICDGSHGFAINTVGKFRRFVDWLVGVERRDNDCFEFDAQQGQASLILDFGQTVVGSASVTVSCPTTQIGLRYGEDLIEAMTVDDPFPVPNWYRLPADSVNAGPQPTRLTTPGRRAFRFLHLLVRLASDIVSLSDVVAELRHYPVSEVGQFNSSDPRLN